MLCLPTASKDGCVVWPQLEFSPLVTCSGVTPSGTVVVRFKVSLPAESIFPCVGLIRDASAYNARFHPYVVSVEGEDVAFDGNPACNPAHVKLSCQSGFVSGIEKSVCVGNKGWSFYPYCREPPPALTLSTTAIVDSIPFDVWYDNECYAPVQETFSDLTTTKPSLPVIVLKRDVDAGEEFTVVFNQFDGIGRMWTYPSPSPFVRIPSAVHLLRLPKSLNVIRDILYKQETASTTDSYVKLLEDTAGIDARTSERINVTLLNLTKAAKHYIEHGGEVISLPLVLPIGSAIAHPVDHSTTKRAKPQPQQALPPVFASSFRIPQSYIPF